MMTIKYVKCFHIHFFHKAQKYKYVNKCSTIIYAYCLCSIAKSCLTLCNPSLQHANFSCPSLFPRVCSDSCPLSQWCYLTISSSPAPFSHCLQSFPASGSSSESTVCIRWSNYWSSSFSISPSSEYSGLISFRIDCMNIVQSCPAFYDPVDCSPPGSAVPGILQARILQWVAISFPS